MASNTADNPLPPRGRSTGIIKMSSIHSTDLKYINNASKVVPMSPVVKIISPKRSTLKKDNDAAQVQDEISILKNLNFQIFYFIY